MGCKIWEARLAQLYDVTLITVRPGTHPQALAALGKGVANDPALLACWYSDIGAVNQILIIRNAGDAAAAIEARFATQNSANPLGVGEYIAAMAMDTYAAFDFIAPMHPGEFGPCYEVRSYVLKPGSLTPTMELWRKEVPGRMTISPVLAGMTSVTGAVTRFMHIWPYKSFDERARLRDKAVADGVWPPPGGPGHLLSQQVDIYLPATFSPMR
jgi:NIPSNAP